jgi:hypothetical protein
MWLFLKRLGQASDLVMKRWRGVKGECKVESDPLLGKQGVVGKWTTRAVDKSESTNLSASDSFPLFAPSQETSDAYLASPVS